MELSVQDLKKLIKIEWGLFPFKGPLPKFLHDPIKTFKWEKFFEGDIKVYLDVVNMFYAAKFHPTKLYAAVDREKDSLDAETINELYKLQNEVEAYPGNNLINKLRVSQSKY